MASVVTVDLVVLSVVCLHEAGDTFVARCAQVASEPAGKRRRANGRTSKAKYLLKGFALPALCPAVCYRCTVRDEGEHAMPLEEYANSDEVSERPVIMVDLPMEAEWLEQAGEARKRVLDQAWALVGNACNPKIQKKELILCKDNRFVFNPAVRRETEQITHLLDGLHMAVMWSKAFWPAWKVWGRALVARTSGDCLVRALDKLHQSPESYLVRADDWALDVSRMSDATFASLGVPLADKTVWEEVALVYRAVSTRCAGGQGRAELPHRVTARPAAMSGVAWLLKRGHMVAYDRAGVQLDAAGVANLLHPLKDATWEGDTLAATRNGAPLCEAAIAELFLPGARKPVFFVTGKIAKVHAELAKAVQRAAVVRVVHAPEWRPLSKPSRGTIDGVHAMTDDKLLRALASFAEDEELVFRGDAACLTAVGSEHYMQALATWADRDYLLETEEPEVREYEFVGEREAQLWVCIDPELAWCDPSDRPSHWTMSLVLDATMRLGLCVTVMGEDGKTYAKTVDDACVARVCWSVARRDTGWEGRSAAEHVSVSQLRRVHRVPLLACKSLADTVVDMVGIHAPGGLEASGWDGSAMRRACRLGRAVTVHGDEPDAARDMAASRERKAFAAFLSSMLPHVLQAYK
jgi:hypothetical protein